MKKRITAVILAALMGAAMLAGCGNKAEEAPAPAETTAPTAEEPVEKVTPTLMYFISNSDETFDEEQKTVEELQNEYNGSVNFDVINIDENTEAANNFPVQGQTPMVIMLDTSNNISAMSPMTYEKDALKEIIDAALNA